MGGVDPLPRRVLVVERVKAALDVIRRSPDSRDTAIGAFAQAIDELETAFQLELEEASLQVNHHQKSPALSQAAKGSEETRRDRAYDKL